MGKYHAEKLYFLHALKIISTTEIKAVAIITYVAQRYNKCIENFN